MSKEFEKSPRSRRVIQLTVAPDRVSIVSLGKHNNMMITSYDDDLILAEGSSLSGTKFLDPGETVTLLNDSNETIFLRSGAVSSRVRIIVW